MPEENTPSRPRVARFANSARTDARCYLTTVQQHYETHLGPIYSWMLGDIDAAFAKSAAELATLHLPKTPGGAALDLGAGFGLHALPLAQRGYAVTASDNCGSLLEELRARAQHLPIKTVHADIAAFGAHVEQPLEVILCMGDTLTRRLLPISCTLGVPCSARSLRRPALH